MKKALLCILSCILACTGAACSKRDDTKNPREMSHQVSSTLEDSRTYTYFSTLTKGDYYLVMECEMEGIPYTMTQASQGNEMYLDWDLMGNKSATFTKNGYTYSIDYTQKNYSITETLADNQVNTNMLREITDNLSDGYTTEEREVDGTVYYTESFLVEDGSISCCFDAENLVYLFQESTEGTIRLKFSKGTEIPAGLFEVPEGFVKLEQTT